jgi:post-segregation antitoxin (ccd killing protein)
VSEAAWQEVLDTARDYGIEISRSTTTGAQRSRLARELRDHEAALAAANRLTDAHNAAHFADPERPDFRVAAWDDVATIRAALHERAGKDARRAARTVPLSALPTGLRGWLLRRRRARARKQRRKES